MSIQVLHAEVVAKIAAGEVVEGPASVVKELVENSLDAAARSIQVEIVGGGCDLIRVADDGCGMGREDLLLAVQRHATSKIRSAEDLAAVATLGFRGEALASIAAVSELTVVSRQDESASASQLRVEGGTHLQLSTQSRARGSTVTVERLFFNTPARRKFLRSSMSEGSKVARMMSRLALAYPEVSFELLSDGRRSLVTAGTGDLLDAVIGVLGREVALALLAVEATVGTDRSSGAPAARVSGYVADPRVNRSTRTAIWLCVNRRPVTSRSLSHAVEAAYQTLMPAGRYPVAVLHLEVPPSEVDVNVHPSKTEVRLLRERIIYGGMRDAVRSVLAAGSTWGREIGTPAMVQPEGHQVGQQSGLRLVDVPMASSMMDCGPVPAGGRRLPILRLMGQVAQTYIVAEGEQGLYLVDQHAAHERVLYNRLMARAGREGNTQLLLEPVCLELSAGQWELTADASAALRTLGYVLEPFGERSLLIRGVPGELPPSRAVQALQETLGSLSSEGPEADWREQMAISLSCRGAVKAGQSLAVDEMRSLLEALEETDITQQCSHGRPTAILLSHSRLDREFGRH